MSYCVEYNPELKRKYPSVKKYRRKPSKKVFILLVTCVSAYIFVHNGWIKFLLPGNPDVTISAFSALVEQVGEGDSIKQAVLTFCEEIITNSGT